MQSIGHATWRSYALPTGTNEHGELTWTLYKFDIVQLELNLSELDEDKVKNVAMFSPEYITQHQKGTKFVADSRTVLFSTSGLNSRMTVHAIDPEKLEGVKGQTGITESQMGARIEDRKGVFLVFSDQDHADAFQKAIQKAIVLCKAQ